MIDINIPVVTKYSVLPLYHSGTGLLEDWEIDADVSSSGEILTSRTATVKLTLYSIDFIPQTGQQILNVVDSVDDISVTIEPERFRINNLIEFNVQGADLYNSYEVLRDNLLFIPKPATEEDAGEYSFKFKNSLDDKEKIFTHNIEVYRMLADDTELSIKGKDIYLVGNVLNISAVLDPVPEGEVSFKWYKGLVALEGKTNQNLNMLLKDDESSYKLEVTFEDESVGELEFDVLVSSGLYNAHIEPLTHRNSGFTRIPFGELDKIAEYKAEGVDWRTKTEELKGCSAAYEIADWVSKNPDANIEVQESRNGRIIEKDFLIYDVE